MYNAPCLRGRGIIIIICDGDGGKSVLVEVSFQKHTLGIGRRRYCFFILCEISEQPNEKTNSLRAHIGLTLSYGLSEILNTVFSFRVT